MSKNNQNPTAVLVDSCFKDVGIYRIPCGPARRQWLGPVDALIGLHGNDWPVMPAPMVVARALATDSDCFGFAAHLMGSFSPLVGSLIYQWNEDAVEIISLTVHTDYRRRGIASLLLDCLKRDIEGDRPPRSPAKIIGYACEMNVPGILVMSNNGFRQGTVDPGRFVVDGVNRDAISYFWEWKRFKRKEKPSK